MLLRTQDGKQSLKQSLKERCSGCHTMLHRDSPSSTPTQGPWQASDLQTKHTAEKHCEASIRSSQNCSEIATTDTHQTEVGRHCPASVSHASTNSIQRGPSRQLQVKLLDSQQHKETYIQRHLIFLRRSRSSSAKQADRGYT